MREGETFTLDAGGSRDGNGDTLRYSHRVSSGPAADLSGASGSTASVTAPDVDADSTLTVEVTVTDGRGGRDIATASVDVVNNLAPEAALTASETTAYEGQPLSLDASASSDAKGDALTYTFLHIAGPRWTCPERRERV